MKTLLTLLALAAAVGAYLYLSRPIPERPQRLSADNVFYLRRYFSFRTRKGVVGFLPGQEVTLNAAFDPIPGKVLVTDGRYTAAVNRELLTHDMDEADALLAGDSEMQSAISANLAQTKHDADANEEALNSNMADGITSSSALVARQNAVGFLHSRLLEGTTWAGVGSTGGSGYYYTRASAGRSSPSVIAAPLAAMPTTVNPPSSSTATTSSYHAPGINYHGSGLKLDAQGYPQ